MEKDAMKVCRALVNEHRRAIMDELLQADQTISQLADSVSLDRSSVSYHLNVLERLGIVGSTYQVVQEIQSPGKVQRLFTIDRHELDEAIDIITQALPQPGMMPQPKKPGPETVP